jgi:hypothetical protein
MIEVTDSIRDYNVSEGERYFSNDCPDCGANQLFVMRVDGSFHVVKSEHKE